MKLPLYDLEPRNENCWIAPNATIGMFYLIYLFSWWSTDKEVGNSMV